MFFPPSSASLDSQRLKKAGHQRRKCERITGRNVDQDEEQRKEVLKEKVKEFGQLLKKVRR